MSVLHALDITQDTCALNISYGNIYKLCCVVYERAWELEEE